VLCSVTFCYDQFSLGDVCYGLAWFLLLCFTLFRLVWIRLCFVGLGWVVFVYFRLSYVVLGWVEMIVYITLYFLVFSTVNLFWLCSLKL
jgi:hypothetical protein